MTNKIILLITLLSYSVLVSQPFMYLLALKNTQLSLDGSTYTGVRQLIDANIKVMLKWFVYIGLLASLSNLIININTPLSITFITAVISFLALVIDTLLTVKGNMPLNTIINTWSPADYPANWREIRQQWFHIFQYRQIVLITGFVSLVAGVVFGKSNVAL